MLLPRPLHRIGLIILGLFSSDLVLAANRPNILWIMSDDHAAQAVGAYGGRLAELGRVTQTGPPKQLVWMG